MAQGLIRDTEMDAPYTDPRDGQVYETVRYTTTFPDQTSQSFRWMTRNLNYTMEESDWYNGDEAHGSTYGQLYTWEAAMQACPTGWHLPTDEDWYQLSFHFGGNCSAGLDLKADSPLWENPQLRGTGVSYFQALPAGQGSNQGRYFGLGHTAIFWSATDRDETTTWDWKFIRESEVQRWYGGKLAKHSVRCVAD
ncbi:MAG: FISUMP domain-containing protein, partial [Bacteroidota bacterium]